jgi:hypothetical protein
MEPTVLTILASYRCTAACEHCCFDSNPHVKGRLTLDEIERFITEATQYPELGVVVFSGGECFLLGDDLTAAVAHCSALGLRTRCVTNAYWAATPVLAEKRLRPLREAGLGELNVSTGDFHQRFVPEQNVINAAVMATDLGFDNTLIVVELQAKREVTRDRIVQHPEIQRCLAWGEERFKVIESPWMPMDLETSIEQPEQVLVNRTNVHLRTGCASIGTTLVLTPHQRVGFCCGLTREKIPELNSDWDGGNLSDLVMSAGSDFIKIWLAVDGPERILSWAASKDPTIDWENRYAHHCHACLALYSDERVRAAIRQHHRERIDDVLLRYSIMLHAQQLRAAARHGGELTAQLS